MGRSVPTLRPALQTSKAGEGWRRAAAEVAAKWRGEKRRTGGIPGQSEGAAEGPFKRQGECGGRAAGGCCS